MLQKTVSRPFLRAADHFSCILRDLITGNGHETLRQSRLLFRSVPFQGAFAYAQLADRQIQRSRDRVVCLAQRLLSKRTREWSGNRVRDFQMMQNGPPARDPAHDINSILPAEFLRYNLRVILV